MRNLNLVNANTDATTVLQWDANTGQLVGDYELIKDIQWWAERVVKNGSIMRVNPPCSPAYPATDPLRKADELALILAIMDWYSNDLPLPDLAVTDQYVRDENNNIVSPLAF